MISPGFWAMLILELKRAPNRDVQRHRLVGRGGKVGREKKAANDKKFKNISFKV